MATKKKADDLAVMPPPVGGRLVTMTNALIRAGNTLTLGEKRIVMFAASQLDSRKPHQPGVGAVTRISATDYAETYGLDSDTAYSQLQSAAKHLYNRSIQFYEPAYKRNGQPIEPTIVTMRWVGRVKYQKKEGWLELAWWHDLMPHLTGLRRQFTTYQLQQASALRSIYSWRLLELLERFSSTGVAQYSIEDFCVSMGATPKQRMDFNNIKRRIIEPAIKELTEKDGWLIEWEPIKAGRKVAAVRFTFKRNPQGQLFNS